jgi:hypothetical protein
LTVIVGPPDFSRTILPGLISPSIFLS